MQNVIASRPWPSHRKSLCDNLADKLAFKLGNKSSGASSHFLLLAFKRPSNVYHAFMLLQRRRVSVFGNRETAV